MTIRVNSKKDLAKVFKMMFAQGHGSVFVANKNTIIFNDDKVDLDGFYVSHVSCDSIATDWHIFNVNNVQNLTFCVGESSGSLKVESVNDGERLVITDHLHQFTLCLDDNN
jgi:hypothetical protein